MIIISLLCELLDGSIRDMTLKDKLEEFFLHYHKQISIDKLFTTFKVDKEHINSFVDALYELEKEGKIFYDKNKTYMHVPDDFCYYHGTLMKSKSNQFYIKLSDGSVITLKNDKRGNEGAIVFVKKIENTHHPKLFFGEIVRVVKKESVNYKSLCFVKSILKNDGNHFYIIFQDKRIYIPKENLHTAFSGDYVNVQVDQNLGCVVDVLKRHNSQHVFRCSLVNGELKLIPIGASYGVYDLVDKKIVEGDLVVAQFESDKLVFVNKMDSTSLVQNKINALIVDYGFPQFFSQQVLDAAASMDYRISDEEIARRVDLRNLETFTIDPVDAKDLDDAVSLEYVNGIYRLYVHTANPSHYIKMGSSIFNEAFSRAFSIYPITGVIPMLPDEFCNGVCSLNENGDKLAITCRMDLDSNGKLLDFDIFKSIIHSNKQMDYDTVNDVLEKHKINDDYCSFYPTLLLMQQLASILEEKKFFRGAISFEADESKFVFDALGNPTSVKDEYRGISQLIIENFMLLANETIAQYAYHLNLPFIYRNHESPSVQKRDNLRYNLNQKGYFTQKIGNIDNPKILQSFLSKLMNGKNKEERRVISEVVLKSMSRAFYDSKNFGHYGLAFECYGTFTSPARKVSDLLNHMVIETFLDEGYLSCKLDMYRSFIEDNCEYISAKQEDADSLEKEIQYLLLDCYADNFISVSSKARILFVNRYGIYVKDEHGLTGVIPLTKSMILYHNCVMYHGHEYFAGEQINVILKEKREDELIFDFGKVNDKKKVKKKD